MSIEKLVLDLAAHDMIKFGEFTLKSGRKSHVYLDLRTSISYPKIFKQICLAYYELMNGLNYDLICGVPYSALTFASVIANEKQIPMLLKRKEAKDHGTKKILEGVFTPGQKCLILEDVVTTGASILETTSVLEEQGLVIRDICTLIDRHEGGTEKLSSLGYKLHSVISLTQIIEILCANGKISQAEKEIALAQLQIR